MCELDEPIIIQVPQHDPLRPQDVRTLASRFESVSDYANNAAGCEVMKVQGGGRQELFVVVQDPQDPGAGFTYTFRLDGCRRSSVDSQQPDERSWVEACEDIVDHLRILLNTIAQHLERQAKTARIAARSISVSPRAEQQRPPTASEE